MRRLSRGSATFRRVLAGAGATMAVSAAVLGQAGMSQAATAPPPYVPSGSVIHFGARGPAVRALQLRLSQLRYYAGPADGQYGSATVEAVWAFKEVQGLGTRSNPDDAGIAMQHALVHPKAPKVLVPRGGSTRIEVNQTSLVLVLYKNNQPELISHVSTGGGYSYCDPGGGCGNIAHTPDGNYKALSFLPGWVKVPLGEMFNPVFFIGRAYAIHGDTSVPLYAASHGCVRIPMDVASFFHTLVPLGGRTPVYIRGAV
ncbi:MAG: L,D-transpeptidase family protein [Actinomycetota bacterium]|nr:L,D-transpeptidase family protein [Actinomycetota bacterium]